MLLAIVDTPERMSRPGIEQFESGNAVGRGMELVMRSLEEARFLILKPTKDGDPDVALGRLGWKIADGVEDVRCIATP